METSPDAATLAAVPAKEKPYRINVGQGLALLGHHYQVPTCSMTVPEQTGNPRKPAFVPVFLCLRIPACC